MRKNNLDWFIDQVDDSGYEAFSEYECKLLTEYLKELRLYRLAIAEAVKAVNAITKDSPGLRGSRVHTIVRVLGIYIPEFKLKKDWWRNER